MVGKGNGNRTRNEHLLSSSSSSLLLLLRLANEEEKNETEGGEKPGERLEERPTAVLPPNVPPRWRA